MPNLSSIVTPNVVETRKLSSYQLLSTALKVIITTTSGTTSDYTVGIMIAHVFHEESAANIYVYIR